MNFFFGINNEEFSSEIQIPTFQNRNPKCTNISLYKASIEQKMWKIEKLNSNKINDNFFIVKGDEITNYDTYFLANDEDFITFKKDKLNDFNKFTNTTPAFRCNFKIYLKDGGFSSYQSEYPYSMVAKKGSILSSVNSIANKDADKNYIFIRNIFEDPINEKFEAYLVNIKNKKIEEKIEIKTNFTNSFEIKSSLIKPEIFLVTENYLGVPMYISVHDKHISFEHTHPPHEYILSQNKYKIIKDIKNEINEIIG